MSIIPLTGGMYTIQTAFCTHILAFEGNSEVFWFEGSYSEYEENRRKRAGDEQPTRIKYKKLVK